MQGRYTSSRRAFGQFILLAIGLLVSTAVRGQSFPIISLIQSTEFSPRLESYDDPGRVIVTLINTDERPEYEALLRFTLSGPGFSIRTREEFMPFPVTLRRDQPLVLTGAQLREYFDPANLIFEGISLENILANGGSLGEGPASLCVEVYDFNRFFDPPVSNTACATGFMLLHRPPILIEPGTQVTPVNPQQLRFQWQPQHAGVAARYTLEVYEDILPGMGDDLIIDNTQPLLQINTMAPFYLMTVANPPLQIGSRYLVRVRAEDVAGRAVFLNDGWSDIYSFIYETDEPQEIICPEPSRFLVTAIDPFEVELSWLDDPTVIDWTVIDQQGDSTMLAGSTQSLRVAGLTPAEVYNYDLCARCEDGTLNCVSTSVLMPEDTVNNPCGPTLLASQLPIDDERLLLSWNDQPTATAFVIRWRSVVPTNVEQPTAPSVPAGSEQSPRGRTPRRAQQPGRAPAVTNISLHQPFTDSLNLLPGTTQAEIDGLTIGTSYQIEVCKVCPDGSEVCTDLDLVFNGLDDDCITSLDINRVDSTETSLSLSWAATGEDYSADSSFLLIWQISDGSQPADSVSLSYPTGNYTISGLLPLRAYEISLCAECTEGEMACRDLGPFGGCPAEYAPYLVDLESDHALIAWEPEAGDSLKPAAARYKTRVALQWDSLTVGQHSYFTPEDYGLEPEQTTEVLDLRNGFTYLTQISTQCADTVWSDWSEPVRFNTDCSVTDSLWLQALSDSSAIVEGLSYSNAIHYAFEYRQSGQEDWTVSDQLPNSILDLQGLLAETEYEVRMRYWCNQGLWSDYTSSFFFTTLPPCDPPFQTTVDPIFADAAQLNWSNYERSEQVNIRFRPQISGYFYPGNYTAPWQTTSSLDSLIYLNELQGGAAYDFQLQSDCNVNLSVWTNLDEFELLCSPPEHITVFDSTYESALVQLSGFPPAIQSSSLEYRALGDSLWQSATVTYGYASLQGLDDMTYYDLRATTTCTSGLTSEYSDTIQFRTPVKCLVPENLVISDLQPFSAQLDWDVTGTIDEWEVLLKGPTGTISVTTPIMAAPLQTSQPGRINGGEAGENPENESPRSPLSGGIRTPAGGTPATNGPVTIGSLPAGAQQPTFDPYAGWHRYSVSEATKLFPDLLQDTEYQVIVRARCPEFGWTDFSDTLVFRTLKDCQVPVGLVANEILQTSFQANWSVVNNYGEEYLVALESLHPLPIGGAFPTSAPTPAGINTGRTINQGGRNSVVEPPRVDFSDPFNQIYRDSILTPELNAVFTGLRPNTEYRFRTKCRCDNYGWTDFSEWLVFRTDECGAPGEVTEEALDRSTMQISWNATYGTNNYEFKYKLADDPGADWITSNTPDSFIVITDLLSNQIYDYQVGEICLGSNALLPAPQDSFLMKRPSINNGFYACGLETEVDLSNEIPLASLMPDDTIIAFDFPIVITSANGGGGYFSGTGDIRMPYFNKAKFSFAFDNIFVNDEYRMVGGYMEATGFGVEVLPPWADSLLSDIIDVLEIADSILELELIEELNELAALGENAGLPPDLQQEIQDVLDCFLEAQNSTQIDSCSVLADSMIAVVNAFLETRYEGDFQVLFDRAAGQQYGIDVQGGSDPASWYTNRDIAGTNYSIPYKSVRQSYPEVVNGIIQTPGVLDSVAFSQTSGIPLPVVDLGDSVKVSFMGLSGNPYYLVAEQITGDTTPSYIAGMLKVVPYPELPLQVVLVPLSSSAASGINASTVQQGLRNILSQAVVNPSVSIEGVLTVPGFDGTLDAVGSGLLTNYSPEMRDIIDALENRPEGYDPNAHYLFLTDDYETTSRAGFMPRGRHFGFLYIGNAGTGADFNRTLAHELAHGAYVLKHSYDEYESELPEGQTDNLMDVGVGSRLYKWQWDLIHNPVNAPLLPGDETGQSLAVDADAALDDNPPPADPYVSIDPSCKYVKTARGVFVRFSNEILNSATFLINGDGEVVRMKYDNRTFKVHYAINDVEGNSQQVSTTSGPRFRDIAMMSQCETTRKYDTVTGDSVTVFSCPTASRLDFEEQTYCDPDNNITAIPYTGAGGVCDVEHCGIVINRTKAKIQVSDIRDLIDILNEQYNLVSEDNTGDLLSKIFVTNVDSASHTADVQEYLSEQTSNSITLWLAVTIVNDTTITGIDLDASGFYKGSQKMPANTDNKCFALLNLMNQVFAGSSDVIEYLITSVTDPVSSILQAITKAISSIEIPERFYNCDAEDYNPILFEIYQMVEGVTPFGFIQQWLNDVVTEYLQQEFPLVNFNPDQFAQMKFAFMCGALDEVFNTIAAVPMLVDLLVRSIDDVATSTFDIAAFFTDPDNNLAEIFSKESILESFDAGMALLDTLGNEIAGLHDPDKPCVLAHTVGREVIFALSFFIGAGEVRAICGAAGQAANLAARLVNLRWIRSVTGNASKTLIFLVAFNAASPSVKLMRGLNAGTEIHAIVAKAGTIADDVVDLTQAVARTDIPQTIQHGGRQLTKVAESAPKPVQIIDEVSQAVIRPATQSQYKVVTYADHIGEILTLAKVTQPNDPNDPNGLCNICQNRGTVTTEYKAICLLSNDKALAGEALNKICSQNLLPTDEVRLLGMGAEILPWTTGNQTRLETFYTDITVSSSQTLDITNRVKDLEVWNINGWEQLYGASFPSNYRRRVVELYDGINGGPKILLDRTAQDPSQNVNLTFDWNNESITEPMTITTDASAGEYRYRFRNFRKEGTPSGNFTTTHHVIPATPSGNESTTIPVGSLFNMQGSIGNPGRIDGTPYYYYSLANAYQLHIGGGNIGVNGIQGMSLEDFLELSSAPLTVWKSLDPAIPGTFTADHRRPMAMRLAGLTDDVTVNWVDPDVITRDHNPPNERSHWWKMTTEDEGEDIDIRVHYINVNGQNKFCPGNTPGKTSVTWTAQYNGGNYQIVDASNNPVSWNTIGLMIPGDCRICTNRSFKYTFEEVCLQAGSTETVKQGLEALCTNNPASPSNDTRLENIALELLSWGNSAYLTEFFDDITSTSGGTDHIANHLNLINVEVIKGWYLAKSKSSAASVRTHLGALLVLGTYANSSISSRVESWSNPAFANHAEFLRDNGPSRSNFIEYINNNTNFIVASDEELRQYLKIVKVNPTSTSYSGNIYRSLSIMAVDSFGALPHEISDYSVQMAWGRYDLPASGTSGGEGALYCSQTLVGNQTEITHYGNWTDFHTYEYTGVSLSNLLDLSNSSVRDALGVNFALLTRTQDTGNETVDKTFNYEFTNVLGTWIQARYDGVIVPGARGAQNYKNVVLFDQVIIDSSIGTTVPPPIPK